MARVAVLPGPCPRISHLLYGHVPLHWKSVRGFRSSTALYWSSVDREYPRFARSRGLVPRDRKFPRHYEFRAGPMPVYRLSRMFAGDLASKQGVLFVCIGDRTHSGALESVYILQSLSEHVFPTVRSTRSWDGTGQ